MNNKTFLYDLGLRLILALLLSINSLVIFYFIFTPLTIYPSFFILKLFYPIVMKGNVFFYSKYAVILIKSCIAGSAYYLLAILNLTTKGMNWKKRVYSFIFSSLLFLILNITRILMMIIILFNLGFSVFDKFHIGFWIAGSTIFVVAIWILTIKIFDIKEIPVYSDIKEVVNIIKRN